MKPCSHLGQIAAAQAIFRSRGQEEGQKSPRTSSCSEGWAAR